MAVYGTPNGAPSSCSTFLLLSLYPIDLRIICLVIAPTFFSAANYVLLNRLVRVTGCRFSMITPDSFTVMFIVADVLCLTIQGVGGGMAGMSQTLDEANTGAFIMTGGVCLQREFMVKETCVG